MSVVLDVPVEEAFEVLRLQARSTRRLVYDVATEVVDSKGRCLPDRTRQRAEGLKSVSPVVGRQRRASVPTLIVFLPGRGGAYGYTTNELPAVGDVITLDGSDLQARVREINEGPFGTVTLTADPIENRPQ